MKKFYHIFFAFIFFNQLHSDNYDCLIVGFLNNYDGIGQVGLSFVNCLKNKLNLKLLSLGDRNKNVPENVIDIVNNSTIFHTDIFDNIESTVLIFTDLLWNNSIVYLSNRFIKFAYSMTEYDCISKKWVESLNNYFDGVIVPDNHLVDSYKNSGVKIPIFVLPLSIKLDHFLKEPLKTKKNNPFVFGCSAGFWLRKNHELLIQAFHEEFGNDPNFKLILHGRAGQNLDNVKKKLVEINATNIQLIDNVLQQDEYVNFFKSLDCYVLVSKGEGFSITPREALALGIPCIITNNTAHKTICKSNLVYGVNSNLIEKAYCEMTNMFIGFNFNCSVLDVRRAMREVYDNYETNLLKSRTGRDWVKKYSPVYLQKKYQSLIKPKRLILGKKNIIKNEYLMTNSLSLYNKFKKIYRYTEKLNINPH